MTVVLPAEKLVRATPLGPHPNLATYTEDHKVSLPERFDARFGPPANSVVLPSRGQHPGPPHSERHQDHRDHLPRLARHHPGCAISPIRVVCRRTVMTRRSHLGSRWPSFDILVGVGLPAAVGCQSTRPSSAWNVVSASELPSIRPSSCPGRGLKDYAPTLLSGAHRGRVNGFIDEEERDGAGQVMDGRRLRAPRYPHMPASSGSEPPGELV